MKKRGQFTLFVVLGVVLLILIGVGLYFKEDITSTLSGSLSYPSEIQEVVDHIQECVDGASVNAVKGIALTGGYFGAAELSVYLEDQEIFVPYYIYEGSDETISLEDLELELGEYGATLVDSCVALDQFSSFEIDIGSIGGISAIENNTLELSVSYPVDVKIGEEVYYLTEPYVVEVEANLGWVHSVASNIVDNGVRNNEELDSEFMLAQGLDSITIVPYGDETLVYILEDTTSFNGEDTLVYLFAEYYPDLGFIEECEEDDDCEEGFLCLEQYCVDEEEVEELNA